MRNAKFRAWYDGKMYPYNEITTYKDGSSACTTISEDGMLRYSPDINKIVIEQYTGLKDNNGKEIYEGDIIKAFTVDEYGYNRNDYVLPVVYHQELGSFGFPVTSNGGYKSPLEDYKNFLWQLDELEVIGNIHENPELLK